MQEVDFTFLIELVFETEGVCPPPKGEMCNFRCALREDNTAIPRQNSFQLGWNQKGRGILYYLHVSLVFQNV